MVLLISVYEREEWIPIHFYIYSGGAMQPTWQAFPLDNLVPATWVRSGEEKRQGAQAIHNFDMKQPNFEFF